MVKAKGAIPDVSSSQIANDSTNNIYVQVFGSSADASDAAPLTPIAEIEPVTAQVVETREVEIPESTAEPTPMVQSQVQAVESLELHEIEEYPPNPRLKRFRTRNPREAEFLIDVQFLRHVIQTLIVKHEITITAEDVQAIMSFFGEVEIRTHKRKIVEREVKEAGCFCSGEKTIEKIIEVIKKIIVAGINIRKYCPDLVSFLSELGISL
jgi:hypothetical protein